MVQKRSLGDFSFSNWYLRIARIPVLLAVGLSFGAYRERASM